MRIPGSGEDKFFVNLNTGYIEWMYYNPDAVSGGQFVLTQFKQDDLCEAVQHYPRGPIGKIFEYVEENCKQYLADVGTPFYRQCANRFEHEAIATGISDSTFQYINELFVAADLINTYCQKEFGNEADFSNLERIGLAYTTTEDEYHEIQVNADLKKLRVETYFNNELIVVMKFESLEEMVDNCLMHLSFDDLVDIPDDALKVWEQNAKADDLAVRLTVFISEVDPYTYADSLEAGEGLMETIAKTREQLRNPVCISETICELQMIIDDCGLENADLYKCYDLMYDLQHLYNDSLNIPVYDRETLILEDIFDAVGVEYRISFDEIGLKVTDGEHIWHDEEFYKWFNDHVLTVEKCRELERTNFVVFADYKELSEHNGVRIGTKIRSKEEKEAR